MARDDRQRWDRKHAAAHDSEKPSAFLREIFESGSWEIPAGRALDIATGKGRNALFLAARGFQVEGIDISEEALKEAARRASERGLAIFWRCADLERVELPEARYDVVLNFNYLERALVPKIKDTLKPAGFLVFETYLTGQEVYGHPKNPAYLLRHNELLQLFSGFRVLCYREGKCFANGMPALRAGLFAQKPG